MIQTVETVAVKSDAFGRIVICKSDFDPENQELYKEPQGEIEGTVDEGSNPPEDSEGTTMTEGKFRALSYADQKAFAALYGITGNGESALVEKLKAEEIL